MKTSKLPSLILAAALQVLPITRAFVATTPATTSSYAIIATWIAGAFALLGSHDAVSGASSISISPASATNGVSYAGFVQYSGAHATEAKSWSLTSNWNGPQSGCNTAYQIAPGLWLTNAPSSPSTPYLVRVGGSPTATGTYSFTLKIHSSTACGGGDSDTRSSSITIYAGSGVTLPAISGQPTNRIITAGGATTFTVGATGTSLAYQWLFNSNAVSGATGATLTLTSVSTGQSGPYSCRVTNSAGSATSSNAQLLVVAPASPGNAPQLTRPALGSGQLSLSFPVSAGYRYLLQRNDDLSTTNWVTLTNIAPSFTPWQFNFTDQPTNVLRFYRAAMRTD